MLTSRRCPIAIIKPAVDAPDRGDTLVVERLDEGEGLVRLTLDFNEASAVREVAGQVGQNLQILSKALGVQVSHRGQQLMVRGPVLNAEQAAAAIEQLYRVAMAGFPLSGADVDQACRMLREDPEIVLLDLYRDVVNIGVGRRQVHPRSPRQRAYVQAIRDHDLVFGLGPAGTGKTYLAMAMAVSALMRQSVRRIVLCRPAVEAGEKLGFLPGDLVEKVNPYLRPLYDAMHDLIGVERSARLMEKDVIEVAPLAFIRGRTLSDAFIILDEAQNATPEQVKMLLTRTGVGSQVVVTGDPTQIDLEGGRSGLMHAVQILEGVDGIASVRFTDADVVRHPLVSAVIRAYARAEAKG